MSKLTITTSSEREFFERGRRAARAADRGERLQTERILSFEDPAEMMRLMTSARLALFRTVRDAPGSITDLAQRLHRDRSAVKRDVDALQDAGMVVVTEKTLPGHGRMREVRAAARSVRLQADVS